MSPQRRRAVSCQTCRRLKTRCTVPPGSDACSRCKTLRLSCELPYNVQSVPETSLESEAPMAGDPPSLVQACNCEERLAALETELADLRCAVRDLSQRATRRAAHTPPRVRHETVPVPKTVQRSQGRSRNIVVAELKDPPVAPVRVIRKMYTWIHGEPDGPQDSVELPGLIEAQLASEGLGLRLIETSRKAIPRLHFMQEIIDSALVGEHNLLSVTCLLAGMQTSPSVSTDLHTSLYTILQSGLAKLTLESPLNLPSLYAMLLTCVLNLTLGYSHNFIDAWLLSSSLMHHLMLSLDFTLSHSTPALYTGDIRNRILTWNSACLQHLKFTIGIGKLSAVRLDLAMHYISIVKDMDDFEDVDKEVAVELELFVLLYRSIVEEDLSADQLQTAFSQWRTANAKAPGSAGSPALDFAMSTFILLAHRWELYQLQQENIEIAANSEVHKQHIKPILRQSHQIIELIRDLTKQQSVLHTFDILISSYAHVTLVELSDYLENIEMTFGLMEEVQGLQKGNYVLEPVASWATNMMKKRVIDAAQSEIPLQAGTLPRQDVLWPPFEALSSRLESTAGFIYDLQ